MDIQHAVQRGEVGKEAELKAIQIEVNKIADTLIDFDSRILIGPLSLDLHGIVESFWSAVVWLRDIWEELEPDAPILLERVRVQCELLAKDPELAQHLWYPLTGLAASIKEKYPEVAQTITELYEKAPEE